MHGGLSTGPMTKDGYTIAIFAPIRHARRCAEIMEMRRFKRDFRHLIPYNRAGFAAWDAGVEQYRQIVMRLAGELREYLKKESPCPE